MQKRDSEGVLFCPKCHAKNISSQKKCGKCGFLFPSESSEKKIAEQSFGAQQAPPQNGFGVQEAQEQEETGGQEEQPQEPQIPKELTGKGQSEGHLRSIGMKTICQICGAENSAHSKRCVRCANRFVKRK